jgi:acyl-homoserine-lactone acylase
MPRARPVSATTRTTTPVGDSLKRSIRLLLLVLAFPAALASCNAPRPSRSPVGAPAPMLRGNPDSARAELLWDDYGVPHIFAADAAALFYAFGWAQMRSHADLLLRLYGQARGRGAEYWGERYLSSDVWVVTNGIPARAQQWWAAQPAHMRTYLESFVAGMNAYAASNPAAVTDLYRQVLPIAPTDVLAHMQRVLHFTFVASPELVRVATQHLQPPGSNAWAVAPSHSSSGKALLLMNPHLPWGEYFTWYETHLALPDMNVYGATLVGMPFVSVGFNDHLGWTHTVNTIDAVDLYDLETREEEYTFDGQVRLFEREEHILRVRQQDGSFATRSIMVRRSVHGPVISARPGRSVALRVAGLDAAHLFEQYWDMARATTRESFESALARLNLPMFTVIYADRRGDIMHVFNGLVPVRSGGDWSYWQGIVPGNTASTLWTDTHRYNELPRVINPPSGWLQNANDPPWTTTLPPALDPLHYTTYMAPQQPLSFRAQRSLRMLAEDNRITFDELLAYKHSTRMESADHLLQDVIAAARSAGDDDARQAAEVLERWDRNADADSRGAVLYAELYRTLLRQPWSTGSLFEVPWNPRLPLVTPDGLSDPRLASTALSQAARRVRTLYGSLDAPWGAVYRFRRDTVDLPANGGSSELGIFRVIDFAPIANDSTRFEAVGGDSFVAAVEFSTPINARTMLVYGNASQPGSPHRVDQLPLAARKEMKPVRLTRESVLQAVRLRELF